MYGLNDVGQRQFDTGVTCAVFSALAVVIRVACKLWHKQGVHMDDCWVVIALVLFWCDVGFTQWGNIAGGGGKEMNELLQLAFQDPSKWKLIQNYLKGIFVSIVIYIATVTALKLSILYFYRRIFFVTNAYRYTSLAVVIFTICWFIASMGVAIFACTPVDKFWNQMKPGECLDGSVVFLVTGIFDILIDFAILVLPIQMAITLHLPLRTRVVVAGIFALGGFVIITNGIRMYYIHQPNSRAVNYTEGQWWSNVHILTAFICACLPVYKPLWNTASQFVKEIFGVSNGSSRSTNHRASKRPNDLSYIEMGNMGNEGSKT